VELLIARMCPYGLEIDIVAKMFHVLRTPLGIGQQICRLISNQPKQVPSTIIASCSSYTGPLHSTVLVRMGMVSDSHFRSPVRSDADQRLVWEPCAHLALTQYAL